MISLDIARQMMILLQAVVQHGTGAAASQMHHAFGGKTGTTNNFTDAWFIGFSPSVTCGTWVGFDSRQSLGEKETGAKAALPIWMDFMKVAVAGKPNEQFSKPNAPKKQLDVLVAPGGADVAPAKPVKTDDPDADNDDDSDKPAPKPAAVAPPAADATPDDEATPKVNAAKPIVLPKPIVGASAKPAKPVAPPKLGVAAGPQK